MPAEGMALMQNPAAKLSCEVFVGNIPPETQAATLQVNFSLRECLDLFCFVWRVLAAGDFVLSSAFAAASTLQRQCLDVFFFFFFL